MTLHALPPWLRNYVFHHPAVRSSGRDREDLLSDVLLRLLVVARRGGVPAPPFEATRETRRSARFCLFDALRVRRPRRHAVQARGRAGSPESNAQLFELLRSLTAEESALFDLLVRGLTQREIARALNTSRSSVNRRVSSLRERVGAFLELRA